MAAYEVKRRTFAAAKHAAGSPERAALNRDPVTSEYMTGTRYLLFCYAEDGSVAWARQFKTKHEAERMMQTDLAIMAERAAWQAARA